MSREISITSEDMRGGEVRTDPETLLANWVNSGRSLAEAKELFDLVNAVRKERAIAAYHRDMLAAQAEMPVVVHDSKNAFLKASYVKLEGIQAVCKPIYTKHGFALSWGEEPGAEPGLVRIVCDVLHREGHSKRHQGDYPIDGTGAKGGSNMNPLQGRVSSNTYAQRDMLRSIFNITIADKDLDGNKPTPTLSEGQIGEIHAIIDKIEAAGLKHDHKKFLEFWGTKDGNTGDLAQANFGPAVKFLKMRLENKK